MSANLTAMLTPLSTEKRRRDERPLRHLALLECGEERAWIVRCGPEREPAGSVVIDVQQDVPRQRLGEQPSAPGLM